MSYLAIEGIVVEGFKISRQLGFPTLNLEVEDGLEIQYGVYAGLMEYENKIYQGVMNIGITPSFMVDKPKLEFHVFNFNDNLYGKNVKITPTHFIRNEIKFDDIQLLIKQMGEDCIIANNLLVFNVASSS